MKAGEQMSRCGSSVKAARSPRSNIENFFGRMITLKLIVTVVGRDRIGIIASVTKILADNNVNILSINQNILDGFFNMILFAEASESKIRLVDLQQKLREQGEAIGVEIKTQHQDIFDVMHKI